MYPNFILLLLYIIILHGNKDRVDRQKDKETFSLEMYLEGLFKHLNCVYKYAQL